MLKQAYVDRKKGGYIFKIIKSEIVAYHLWFILVFQSKWAKSPYWWKCGSRIEKKCLNVHLLYNWLRSTRIKTYFAMLITIRLWGCDAVNDGEASLIINTVKSVLRGHLWDKEKWPDKTGGLLKQVKFIWNFLQQDKKIWLFNTVDCLIEMTVHCK